MIFLKHFYFEVVLPCQSVGLRFCQMSVSHQGKSSQEQWRCPEEEAVENKFVSDEIILLEYLPFHSGCFLSFLQLADTEESQICRIIILV